MEAAVEVGLGAVLRAGGSRPSLANRGKMGRELGATLPDSVRRVRNGGKSDCGSGLKPGVSIL